VSATPVHSGSGRATPQNTSGRSTSSPAYAATWIAENPHSAVPAIAWASIAWWTGSAARSTAATAGRDSVSRSIGSSTSAAFR
jgi:hypothetical protein